VLRWAFIEAVHGVQRTKGPYRFRLRQLYARLCGQGRPKGRKSSAKVAVAHELSKLVYVVWTKRVPYTDTPPPRPGSRQGRQESKESPTAKTTLRSDQPRHPMVRRRATVGQTLKYGPPPGNRRPDPQVIGPFDAAYPFCAGRVVVALATDQRQTSAAAPTRRDSWFYANREMLSDHTGLSQLDHKLMRRRAAS